jgi:hypothetical protein
MALLPAECDAILIIYPDAVATRSSPRQSLEAISRRRAQVPQIRSNVQHLELPLHGSPKTLGNRSRVASVPFAKQIRSGLVGERLNHPGTTVVT